MSVLTAENTACELSVAPFAAAATCNRILREQIPNLFRLYLNPHVAQACYCLTRLVETSYPGIADAGGPQVFLANSGDEALSGAVKLARYAAHREHRSPNGLLVAATGEFDHFAFTELADGGRIEYIPGLEIRTDAGQILEELERPSPPGFIVIHGEMLGHELAWRLQQTLSKRPREQRSTLIVFARRDDLSDDTAESTDDIVRPDLVVLDESLVRHEVPFGAFVATKRLIRHWNRRGMSTFHSTTFQPNTIASLHLLECLRNSRPEFMRTHSAALSHIERDPRECHKTIQESYSRPLARLIRIAGFARGDVRAAGHYVHVGDRRVFDAVAGVACSIRGHNPPTYSAELQQIDDPRACREELFDRLQSLTGLPHVTPAVSGASAVEQALKLGLASQAPRRQVLALRGGFGGKTLFALTGTWKPSLKSGLDPLYPHVVYVDPFAPDACSQVSDAFSKLPIGVVQLELVQAVGGVRAIPPAVLDCLLDMRSRHGCLLLIDEVQTGMYRTGPFVRSQQLGLAPDLLTIGKGTSDMLFPFALTLHSHHIQQRLDQRECRLPEVFRRRSGFDQGYRTVLNVLRWAEAAGLERTVERRGRKLADSLRQRLRHCRAVREVRSCGMLIGIELDVRPLHRRWLRRTLPQLSLLSMLRHPAFPLLVGFCQYEPHVLKLTPPLTITEDEIERLTATIADSLSMPLLQAAWCVARQLAACSLPNHVTRHIPVRTP